MVVGAVLQMPYHKKRKTSRPPRGLTPPEEMKQAVQEVLSGGAVNTVATLVKKSYRILYKSCKIAAYPTGIQGIPGGKIKSYRNKQVRPAG